MLYHLTDLLAKMGAPEVREKGRMEWHSFDRARNCLAGFAEIRLEAGGEFLVAEMKQLRENYEDDDGRMHAQYEESFFLYAERAARPDHYRVTRIAFDGADYGHPTKPLVELGLGVFHARALDISLRMIEQSFNKMDMMDGDKMPKEDTRRAPPMMAAPVLPPAPAVLPSTLPSATFPSAARGRTTGRKAGIHQPSQKNAAGQPSSRRLTPAGFVPLERLAHTEQSRAGYGVVVPFRKREAVHA